MIRNAFRLHEGGDEIRKELISRWIVMPEEGLEVSAVATPANSGTRTLSVKSAETVELVSFTVA